MNPLDENILDFAKSPGAPGLNDKKRLSPSRSQPAAVTLTRASTLKPRPVDWLWRGWLARGKLHIIAGAPGTGKTSIAAALGATVTLGGRWPDGTQPSAGDVVIWSGEDDPADTLIPRLIAAEADLGRVRFVTGHTSEDGVTRSFDPAHDLEDLSVALKDSPPALLIIDPIVSSVAGDSHKNAEVRRSLQPLVDLAARHNCAVLGISHFSKGTASRDPTERVTGSLAFGALPRVVLATAKRSDLDGGGRLLARAKNNLGPDSGGFLYDLAVTEPLNGIEATCVRWGEALEGTARELLSSAEAETDPEERSEIDSARDFLLELLTHGPVSSKDILRDARECNISEKTLRRAQKSLGVIAERPEFAKGWQWRLPREPAQDGPKMAPRWPRFPKMATSKRMAILAILGKTWPSWTRATLKSSRSTSTGKVSTTPNLALNLPPRRPATQGPSSAFAPSWGRHHDEREHQKCRHFRRRSLPPAPDEGPATSPPGRGPADRRQ
jgi:putative DNA primase/helicase